MVRVSKFWVIARDLVLVRSQYTARDVKAGMMSNPVTQ